MLASRAGQGAHGSVTRAVNGIIDVAIDPAVIGSALADAVKAHIPVVSLYNYGGGSTIKPPPSIIADASTNQCDAAKVTVAYMVAHTPGGKPKVAMITDAEYIIVALRATCATAALKAAGADIVSVQAIRAANIATQGPGVASALVDRFPKGQLNYIWAPYDAAALFFATGIQSTGRTDVKIVSFDANAPNLVGIAKGGAEVATVGSALEWAGWAGIDELNRSFDGVSTKVSYGIPEQLLTQANASHPGRSYNYQAKFRKLWGKG